MNLDSNRSPASWQEDLVKQANSFETQQVQNSVEQSNRLHKINDILNVFDFPNPVENEYREFLA